MPDSIAGENAGSSEVRSEEGLICLPDSNDYVKLFDGRNLHWGQPETIEAIVALGREFSARGFKVEVGNITGPTRKNPYSKTHHGGPFDLAYPFKDGASGAKDAAGHTDAPYRLSADATAEEVAAIDFARLFEILSWLVTCKPVWQVLIGVHVMDGLRRHCHATHTTVPQRVRSDGARVIVAEFEHHEDHIHVSIRNRVEG